jgi:hypothetical protein
MIISIVLACNVIQVVLLALSTLPHILSHVQNARLGIFTILISNTVIKVAMLLHTLTSLINNVYLALLVAQPVFTIIRIMVLSVHLVKQDMLSIQ